MTRRAGTTEHNSFDPVQELLTAQADRAPGLSPINLRTLSPFQRALLVIDGTVTKFIEAYTMEPVEVVRLSQQEMALSEDHRWLEAPRGTIVVGRQVLLRGKYSHTFYAYAVSLIVLERIRATMRERLDLEGESLGRILLNQKTETRREVLWYGRERVSDLPERVRRECEGDFISRTYRVIAAARPMMMITERFPVADERLPVHH